MAGYISDDTRKVTTHRLVEMKQRGEQFYAFNSMRDGVPASRNWRDWDYELAEKMNQYWVNFITNGIINNGAKEPTVAELEQQARSGQPISLMDLTDAIHRKEREKKKSVMEQLKSQPKAEHKKTAQKKSAEREKLKAKTAIKNKVTGEK